MTIAIIVFVQDTGWAACYRFGSFLMCVMNQNGSSDVVLPALPDDELEWL